MPRRKLWNVSDRLRHQPYRRLLNFLKNICAFPRVLAESVVQTFFRLLPELPPLLRCAGARRFGGGRRSGRGVLRSVCKRPAGYPDWLSRTT